MTLLRPVVADTPPPAGVAEIATTTQPDVGTPPDAEALFKEARQRRRRRRLTGALALGAFAAVVALVAGALWLPAPSPPTPGTAPAARDAALAGTARAPMPNEIVGWGANANLVVISTRTGDVERTLASHVSVFAPGLPSVSVAPNGTVFFESATPQLVAAAATGGDRILSVSIRGGPVRDLGAGSDPQVSPDGRSVAYIAPEPAGTAGEPPYLVPPQGIDVATLSASGTVAAVRTLEPGPAQVDQGASDLSWSPNGRMLSFDLLNPTTSATTAWTTPVGRGVKSLATARRIPLAAGLTWTGFAGRVGPTNASQTRGDIGEGIGLLSSRADARQTVVSIDPATGHVTARLFRLPAAVCAATIPGLEPCNSLFSDPVATDSNGTSVLVAGATPYGEWNPSGSSVTNLYVWHRGMRAPVRLVGQVDIASWGPSANTGRPTP